MFPSAGVNVHFNSVAQLKVQYTYSTYFDFWKVSKDQRHQMIAVRLVLAL